MIRHIVFPLIFLVFTSCTQYHRAKLPPAPGPLPARIPDQLTNTTPPPPPTNLAAPPAMPPPNAEPAKLSELSVPPPPKAAPPRKPKPRLARSLPPPKPATVESPPTAEPTPPVYTLGEVLDPARRAATLKEVDNLLAGCDKTLAALEGKTLNSTQSETANRIRFFTRQSREARDKNPIEARNLAQRARTFAEALRASLR